MITVARSTPLMLLEYNMGNSVSYNGQGIDLSYGNFTDPEFSSLSGDTYIFDTSSDYANGNYGNIGQIFTNSSDIGFVNLGPSGYLSFDGNGASNGQYISSEVVSGYNIPAGSSYTIFSMVRVNDFGPLGSPETWTCGIVGGDQTIFGFVPPSGNPYVYPLLVAGNEYNADVIDDTTQFQPNTWYAVAVTYDATSQTMRLYVNGVNTATSTGIAPFVDNEPLYWGTWEGSNYLNGDLAVMTVWGGALSPSELNSYIAEVGDPYGVTSASVGRQYNDMPLQTYSQLFPTPTTVPEIFTVPAGVTNISVVAVGAGGGGGGALENYSPAGGDTYVYTQWDQHTSEFFVTNAGYNINQLIFDCSTPPTNSIIGNVAPGWLVTGTKLNESYLNKASSQGGMVIAVVTSIDSSDLASVVVTLNLYIDQLVSITDGFYFQGQGIVGAQGGWDSTGTYSSGYSGPGLRAIPTIGYGGNGGVQNYFQSDNVGGAGAGGYGTTEPIVAYDPNQTFIYNDNEGDIYTGVADVYIQLSNDNLTAAATANNTSQGIATGTYGFSDSKVMFSLTVDANAPFVGLTIGFGNYNANLQLSVGVVGNSAGFKSDGDFIENGLGYPGYPTYVVGDVVDIAIDDTNQSAWIRVNGGDWNGNPSADPVTNSNGAAYTVTGPLYLMTTQGDLNHICQLSINTSNTYSIPSGYTFVAGSGFAGSTGGDGSNFGVPTMRKGQGQGGSGAGGGGIVYNTGAGGGGVGLYGAGEGGNVWVGSWIDSNTKQPPDGNGPIDNTTMATGSDGGSTLGNSGTRGGTASQWAAGSGGWPGGAGGSGVDYYGAGNAGALAYVNNVAVTPGQAYFVIVGKGGTGSGFSGGVGAGGAVRIVWPGNTRQFPSTNVGVDSAGPTSLTISTSYFTQGYGDVITSGGFVVGLNMSGTFTIGEEYVTLYNLQTPALAQDIYAFFTQAGMYKENSLNYPGDSNRTDFNAYIFNVTWADSSTGIVRMAWGPGGYLRLSVVDTATNDWQIASPLTYPGPTNLTKAGTFNFPATFTPYAPLTEANGSYWC